MPEYTDGRIRHEFPIPDIARDTPNESEPTGESERPGDEHLRQLFNAGIPKITRHITDADRKDQAMFGLRKGIQGALIPRSKFGGAILFVGTANPEFDEFDDYVKRPQVAYIISESWLTTGHFTPEPNRTDLYLYAPSAEGSKTPSILTPLVRGFSRLTADRFPGLAHRSPTALGQIMISEDHTMIVFDPFGEEFLIQTAYIDKSSSVEVARHLREYHLSYLKLK